jgi:hypothetical protein
MFVFALALLYDRPWRSLRSSAGNTRRSSCPPGRKDKDGYAVKKPAVND